MKRSINNVELGYDDHGAGLPVIFLHAFPLNRSMWRAQVAGLLSEQRFRLVALDWRGFGESEINVEVSSMALLADDVLGVMDVLGMQQAILCALSMGGYVAFNILRRYPQRVGGLILADTKPGADNEEGKANREKVAQLAESQGTGAIAEQQTPRLLSAYTRSRHPEIELQVRQMINAATSRGIAAASRGMGLRDDSTDLLPAITCPTLVIVGEDDSITPPDLARDYAAMIPSAQFAQIPQAGHLSNLEQPGIFLEVVRNFLLGTF